MTSLTPATFLWVPHKPLQSVAYCAALRDVGGARMPACPEGTPQVPGAHFSLSYHACLECERGLIMSLVLPPAWRGSGLGRSTVEALVLEHFPQLSWSTTVQRGTAVPFWEKMAQSTGQPLRDLRRERCLHHGEKPILRVQTLAPFVSV